jgi:glutamate formiminotransferase/glutamate formiminotransferase/formiminotetrahydrofolate cyclodeaminase
MPTTYKRPLLAVPNVSEGRDLRTVEAIAQASTAGAAARLYDVHSDADHHRSVLTLAGSQGELAGALLAGAREAVERIDVRGRAPEDLGAHPHVGALDVVPIVYLDPRQRGAACAEALVVAYEIGELGVPVLLYGELARGRTRAELRRGGAEGLAARLEAGELRPDFGPAGSHPTAGATLVAAREPLVAFNVELAAPASAADARRIASLIREGGVEGIPGLRAIGVELRGRGSDEGVRKRGASRARAHAREAALGEQPIAQVSMNVERPLELTLRAVLEAIERYAPVACAELVGLAPLAALEGFPAEVPLRGFDPRAHVIENALGF